MFRYRIQFVPVVADWNARRSRITLAAIFLILAVAGCDGPPPGAKEAVQRLAALDIVTSPPPQ